MGGCVRLRAGVRYTTKELSGPAQSGPEARLYTVSSWNAGGQLTRVLDDEGRMGTRAAAFVVTEVRGRGP